MIPLIILYLLRPKPREELLPSLMFILKVELEKRRIYTSITKIVKDPLFLIQLLVLVLLSLAAAGFYYTTNEPLSGEHTVIVLDTSASMQTDGRFSDAVKIAEGYVSQKNSIVLASNVPLLALEGEGASAANGVLKSLQPGAGVADISGAISAGMRLLSNEGGRIIVISDFTNWKGDDPVSSKTLAESYGIKVNFVKVGKPAKNLGIINGWLEAANGSYSYTGVVKNYGESGKTVQLETRRGGDTSTSKSFALEVPAGETNQFKLADLKPGITEVQILNKDSLAVDNTAYISIPEAINQNVLYVTDDGKLPSRTALSLLPNSNVTAVKAVPGNLSAYDLVVLANKKTPVENDSISRIQGFVEKGGSAVFIASKALEQEKTDVGLVKLLPVKPVAVVNVSDDTRVGVEEIQKSRVTQDINLEEISVHKYMNASLRTGSITLAALENNVPVLSYWQVGKGTVFYMGFDDELGDNAWNNFHNLPEYPVFWIKLAEWLGGGGDISDYNLKTGTYTALARTEKVQTPTKVLTANRLVFDEAGVYEIEDKKIAVNLYDDPESDTTVDASPMLKEAVKKDEPKLVRATSYTAKKDISNYLIGAVLLLMLLELIIVRRRGEL